MTGAIAQSVGTQSLGGLYGFGSRAASFAAAHVGELKESDNAVAQRCGEVIEAAVAGFALGEEMALVVIGIGQALLGNPLSGTAVAGAAIGPIALTCASIGAIHYGWNALSKAEQTHVLDLVGKAFSVGIELIRSIVRFVLETIRHLMSKENYAALHAYIADTAHMFGRKVSDITGTLTDHLSDLAGATVATANSGIGAIRGRLGWGKAAEKDPTEA